MYLEVWWGLSNCGTDGPVPSEKSITSFGRAAQKLHLSIYFNAWFVDMIASVPSSVMMMMT